MPQSPLDILQNAARLKGMQSSTNMDTYGDIFAGPAEGHVPTAFEQQTGDANADMAETALGAGPAINSLRDAFAEMEREKYQGADNQEADFLEHGMDRGVARANVQNQTGDMLSEGAARRSFLPFAERAGQRDAERAESLAQTRYLQPAQIQAQGNVLGRQADAQGRIGAAQAKDASLPTRALFDALNAFFEKKGRMPEGAELQQLKQTFGVQ